MKYLFFFCILSLIISCNDGDLTIETIDFNSVTTVQSCDSPSIATTLFFKINDNEALILELESGILKNESSVTVSSAVPSKSKVIYRTFSDKVSSDYFCDDIPTTEPAVVEEIEATAGEVLITTSLASGGTSFDHKIELSGITFITSQDERITDLQINEFGTVTTSE